MSHLGTEKIENIAEQLKELIIVGKKVKADGKVDANDLVHVIGLLPKLPTMIDAFKDLGEAIEEGKDIDVTEIIALIQKVNSLVKEIEKA